MKTNKSICSAIAVSISASLVAGERSISTDRERILSSIKSEMKRENIYKVHFKDTNKCRQAAKDFHNNLMETHYDEDYLVLELTDDEKEEITTDGYELSSATEFMERRNGILMEMQNLAITGEVSDISIASIPEFSCYETVEGTFSAAESIVSNHPDLAEWIDAGDSWEKVTGRGGYDIYVLKLTNKNTSGNKPKLFVNSAIHAREYTTAPLNLAFANWLIDHYGNDADATWILDHHEVHLMLQSNPDGRKQAEMGISWRKNTNQNYCGSTSNGRGVDLNRNFSFDWNITNGLGSSSDECSFVYRGPSPASEPETQAIENYVRSLWPDSRGPNMNDAAPRTTSGIHIDIHSYSELVLWPWGSTDSPAPNGTDLQTLGRKFGFLNGYFPEPIFSLTTTDGSSDGISYGELGVAFFAFELGTDFFQNCQTYTDSILPGNLDALIYAAKVARTPYITPSGPDITSLNLDANVVEPSTPVNLTIITDDERFNNSNGIESTQSITAVEYYVDTPPWTSGAAPISMSSDDGSFDEAREMARAIIDTSNLNEGQHTIFVRAQDDSGTWGAISAEFLTITDDISSEAAAIPNPSTPTTMTFPTNAATQPPQPSL